MKIVADDKIPFLRGVFESAGCDVVYLAGKNTSCKDVADADAVITRTRTKCNASLLAGSKVKIVATATIGTDHFNIPELDDLGISWCNAPGCNSSSVAQYVTAALTCFGNCTGKTLGVIGAGNVGSKVVKCAQALGMNVLVNDPPREEREGKNGFVSLDEILEKSDFITVHVPLEKDGKYPTFHLCGDDFFGKLKKKIVFINSSRGEVVDTESLKKAIKSGKIEKTALDVWENEPQIDTELLALAAITTPHIAGYSLDGKANGTIAVVRAVAEKLGINQLKDWDCKNIVPAPESGTNIVIPNGVTGFDAVKYAVSFTYDITKDSLALKSNVGDFEDLRGNYYIRREFTAFTVSGCDTGAADILKTLGFVVI